MTNWVEVKVEVKAEAKVEAKAEVERLRIHRRESGRRQK
jgi:hypothetical protein